MKIAAPFRIGALALAGLGGIAAAPIARGETLTITSVPSGASIQMNGIPVGATPYEAKFPGGYFHKTHSVFSERLEHPMAVRLSKEGYASKEILLTDGPIVWRSINGKAHGNYWLLKTDHLEVVLEPIARAFTGTIGSGGRNLASPRLELSVEEIVRRASPAVVLLKTSRVQGTGFLLTGTGVIATNKHVAEGESSLLAVTAEGSSLEANVIYADPNLDLALVKVEGVGLPHLSLADIASVHPGQTVIAIGNPGDGLPNTATKGIVSAVGRLASETGTWVQTDAALNPGNSGGPLLNTYGEVVGINTLKAEDRQGIGFALSASDLLALLRRFDPEADKTEHSAEGEGFGTVTISSDPQGAEIYLDGSLVGTTPSVFKLAAGRHHIRIKLPGKQTWWRDFEVLKDSDATLNPSLLPTP
ncbi:MAG: trypsin-like peptidase domain-containing protein [Candidatus Acidiferrales bacterium]